MSQKYSFIIIVESNGSTTSKVFKKEDAQRGLDEFAKIREQGKEAYFYHFPKADKRCKSEKAMDELNSFTKMKSTDETKEEEEVKPKASKKAEKPSSSNLDI